MALLLYPSCVIYKTNTIITLRDLCRRLGVNLQNTFCEFFSLDLDVFKHVIMLSHIIAPALHGEVLSFDGRPALLDNLLSRVGHLTANSRESLVMAPFTLSHQ